MPDVAPWATLARHYVVSERVKRKAAHLGGSFEPVAAGGTRSADGQLGPPLSAMRHSESSKVVGSPSRWSTRKQPAVGPPLDRKHASARWSPCRSAITRSFRRSVRAERYTCIRCLAGDAVRRTSGASVAEGRPNRPMMTHGDPPVLHHAYTGCSIRIPKAHVDAAGLTSLPRSWF